MGSNGKHRPARPRIELGQASATPAEAAAIAAAIEQFLRDTAPAPAAAGPAIDPWTRTGLFEGVGRSPDETDPWGDPEAWGSRPTA